jgi:hypothetical protein
MTKVAALAVVALLLIPGVALAGPATDAALGLGAFAAFNQIISGTGIFVGVAPRPVVVASPPVVVAPAPPVYVAPPPPPVYVAPRPVVVAPAARVRAAGARVRAARAACRVPPRPRAPLAPLGLGSPPLSQRHAKPSA